MIERRVSNSNMGIIIQRVDSSGFVCIPVDKLWVCGSAKHHSNCHMIKSSITHMESKRESSEQPSKWHCGRPEKSQVKNQPQSQPQAKQRRRL